MLSSAFIRHCRFAAILAQAARISLTILDPSEGEILTICSSQTVSPSSADQDGTTEATKKTFLRSKPAEIASGASCRRIVTIPH